MVSAVAVDGRPDSAAYRKGLCLVRSLRSRVDNVSAQRIDRGAHNPLGAGFKSLAAHPFYQGKHTILGLEGS
jgi:hypothetical protein